MSDLYHAPYAYYPGFLDLIFNMDIYGKISNVIVKELIIVNNKPFINNEFSINLYNHTTDFDINKRILKRKV